MPRTYFGFNHSIGYLLLKHISFKPDNITIPQHVIKGKDIIKFQLFFQSNPNRSYTCVYYDAILRKEIQVKEATINEINTYELEERMAEINWSDVFGIRESRVLQSEDISTWPEVERVESIVNDLVSLEANEDGKDIAIQLKMKYWCDTPIEEMVQNISSLKVKFEISQRFYFLDGQGGISTDEAYRFLNNRWLEKQLQAKKKYADASNISELSKGGLGANKSLLKKLQIEDCLAQVNELTFPSACHRLIL
jgi:hypothetical protein